VQIRQIKQQRFDRAAIELARIWHNPEFGEAMRMILELPPEATESAISGDKQVADAAMLVAVTIETLGIMVQRRIVEADLVWELTGGMVLAAWSRMEDWVRSVRRDQNNPKFAEWNEWLAEQLKRFAASGRLPAHEQHRDWTP
jgi:hypothetical protein